MTSEIYKQIVFPQSQPHSTFWLSKSTKKHKTKKLNLDTYLHKTTLSQGFVIFQNCKILYLQLTSSHKLFNTHTELNALNVWRRHSFATHSLSWRSSQFARRLLFRNRSKRLLSSRLPLLLFRDLLVTFSDVIVEAGVELTTGGCVVTIFLSSSLRHALLFLWRFFSLFGRPFPFLCGV